MHQWGFICNCLLIASLSTRNTSIKNLVTSTSTPTTISLNIGKSNSLMVNRKPCKTASIGTLTTTNDNMTKPNLLIS